MRENGRTIAIVGGGIAGLCAAVYARKCGYRAEVLEQQDRAGGLATSWRRGAYTFETCLHWLAGSGPNGALHAQWREVSDIGRLTFVNPEVFVRLETERGETLSVYTNVDRMETEFLRQAPEDAGEIHRLASAIRRLGRFPLPGPPESWHDWLALSGTLPWLPMLWRWSRITAQEYSRRFTNPLLRSFFGGGEMARLSALAVVFSLAWMNERNAGYPIGGSQAVIGPIVENLRRLGGNLRLGARAAKILVERDAATGVQLAGGETVRADWVISAADGHATIYELLGGLYKDEAIDSIYDTLETFPSYVQVSLGVARDLPRQAGYTLKLLDVPLKLDPETELRQLALRFFNFDPTFAPAGKTAVTCFLPTRNFEYWAGLQRRDPLRYQEEKHRVAEAVTEALEMSVPGIGGAIEATDVSTPASVIQYTGNWKGSMEGWLLTPRTGLRPLPRTLPGLRQFLMAGQWVMPGGGLPSGLLTSRSALQAICRQDGIPFGPEREGAGRLAA